MKEYIERLIIVFIQQRGAILIKNRSYPFYDFSQLSSQSCETENQLLYGWVISGYTK